MKINIKKADKSDLADIIHIYEESGLDTKGLEINDAVDIFNKITQYPDYNIFIAQIKEQTIGTFAILIMDNLAHRGTPSAIIEDVGVLPEFQKKGIGKEMMEFAMSYAKQKGCYKMILSSNLKREKAHKFYEALGFEKHGYSFRIEI